MKRVVLISEGKVFGGAEVYLERLARHLPGWRAELAVPDREEFSSWRAALDAASLPNLSYAPTPAGWVSLVRRLRRDPPDLVHLNLPNTYDGASGLAAAWLHAMVGRPVVVTEHLTQIPRSRRRRLVKLWTTRTVPAILVVSRASRATLIAEGIPGEKIVVIPNGVPDPGPPAPLPPGDGPLCIGVLGSLEPRKHVDLLVQVAAGLKEVPLRLEIGGDGPLRPALERLADRLGEAARVIFAGPVADPFAFLARQHLLALPSRLEGMPLVVLEAFAAGRPALASLLPGMDEVVDEGRTGRLLPLSDVEAWKKAVGELAGGRERLARWGREARVSYEKQFTVKRAAADTAAVYERVLAEAARS